MPRGVLKSPGQKSPRKKVQFGQVDSINGRGGFHDDRQKKKKKRAIKLRFLVKESNDDPERILTAVEANANPNEQDSSGQSVLSLAVSKGFAKVAETLIRLKADVNVLDDGGWNPLLEAANIPQMHGLLETLVACSKDIQATTHARGWGVLHLAARKAASESTIRLLVESKAQVNLKDNEGITAISHACRSRENKSMVLETIKALIQNKADPDARDNNLYTAMHFAAFANAHGAIPALIEAKADPTLKNSNGYTPLLLAVQQNSIEFFEKLLGYQQRSGPGQGKKGFHGDPSQGKVDDVLSKHVDPQGRSALHIVAEYSGSESILSSLIEKKCAVNKEDYFDNTALHKAASNGRVSGEFIQILLGAKADPLIRNEKGQTALHIAVASGKSSTVMSLLNLVDGNTQARPNEMMTNHPHSNVREGQTGATNNEGETALHLAVTSLHEDSESIVAMLLGARANPDAKHRKCIETPFKRALRSGKTEIQRLLRISRYPPLLQAAAKDDLKSLKKCIRDQELDGSHYDSNVNSKEINSNWISNLPAEWRRHAIFRHLQKYKWSGEDPITVCVRHRSHICLDFTVRNLSNFEKSVSKGQHTIKKLCNGICDSDDETPLMMAIRLPPTPRNKRHREEDSALKSSSKSMPVTRKRTDMIRTLIDAKASPNSCFRERKKLGQGFQGFRVTNTVLRKPKALTTHGNSSLKESPLFAAVALEWTDGRQEIVQELLLARASASIKCGQLEWSPLHEAAHRHRPVEVGLILDSQNTRIRNETEHEGMSGGISQPSLMSIDTQDSKTNLAERSLETLPSRGTRSTLFTASISQFSTMEIDSLNARLMARSNVEDDPSLVSMKDSQGNTPLHVVFTADVADSDSGTEDEEFEDEIPVGESACESGSKEMIKVVELLLHAGSDLKAENNDGFTPVKLAKANKAMTKCYKTMKRFSRKKKQTK